jgi:hypothetical protein
VPIHSLSSRPGWGTPEVAYELGVSALNLVHFLYSWEVSSIQILYFSHRKIIYELNMCLSRFLCHARHSYRNMQSLWGLSTKTRRQKRGIFYGICPKGRTRGLWVEGACERKSAPCKDGGGGMQLAPEKDSCWCWAGWLGSRIVVRAE